MYNDNETLILLQDVGIKGKKGFIPKDTEVIFIKAIDNPNDLTKAMLVIQFKDRQLALPELVLAPKENKTIDALKAFNIQLMASNPSLKKYHHNRLFRLFYIISGFLHSIFIAPIKKLIVLLTPKKSEDDKKEALVKEIKALMEEE